MIDYLGGEQQITSAYLTGLSNSNLRKLRDKLNAGPDLDLVCRELTRRCMLAGAWRETLVERVARLEATARPTQSKTQAFVSAAARQLSPEQMEDIWALALSLFPECFEDHVR